ncbi:hypothetical protein [Bradyrhizobium japonicum]|uniref:hypothetical protein n=1 Tax=Bradyrhizobium japonicum TaxID=375 RepID=UPI001BAAC362|nr:hypothetical protein [Bradyrhizobium japonicum]MBR0915470.1 hypothetical protein [Bradyrhizobium japonicum]
MGDRRIFELAAGRKVGGAAVDVFALALTPSFLRAIRSMASFAIPKAADDVCSPDTSKNASKPDSRGEFLCGFSICRENFLVKIGIEPVV